MFENTATEIARSYIESRQQVVRMWRAAVDGLNYAYSPAYERSPRPQPTEAAVGAIADLTQLQLLAAAVADIKLDSEPPPVLALRDQLRDMKVCSLGTKDVPWGRAEEAFKAAMLSKTSTTDYTGQMALWLVNLQPALIMAEPDIFKGCPKFKDVKSRAFGLVRGPSIGDGESSIDETIKSIEEAISVIGQFTAGGFERGRTPQGLEALTDRYLALLAQPTPSSEEERKAHERDLREARRILTEALIGFAEKVLTIANNEVLLAPAGAALESGLDRYVVVLQAVGNALLVQADELTHREAHKAALRARTESEVAAAEGVLRRSPRRAFDELAAAVQADRARAEGVRAETTAAVGALVKALEAPTQQKTALAPKQAACPGELKSATKDVADAQEAMKGVLGAHAILVDEADRVKAKIFAPPEADVQAKELRDKIVDWAKAERDAIKDQGDPRRKRLEDGQTFLAAFNIDSLPGGARKTVYDAILALLKRSNYDADSKRLAGLQKTLEEKTATCASDKAKLATATKSIDELEGMKKTAEEERRKAEARNEALVTLAEWLNARRSDPEIVPPPPASTAERQPWSPPAVIYEKAAAKLRLCTIDATKADCRPPSEPDAAKAKPKLQAAFAELERRNPPLDPASMDFRGLAEKRQAADGGKHANGRAVLDDLIGLLRYEHMRAVYENGADSERVRQIEESLKSAFDHRTGMAYIRPSAAYLRNSYPASSLQADPGLSWRNMLEEHALRNFPFLGQYHGYNAERAKITAEIDKQFWQNINSVRVSGAGDTKQVIAKDDVGNWYVKAYSGDPARIFKSAKSLALFHLGGKFNADLLARDARRQPGAGGAGAAPAEPTTLERLFDRHRRAYEEATKAEYGAALVVNADRRLATRIQNAWQADVAVAPFAGTLANAPVAAAGPLDEAIAAARGAQPADQPLRIVDIGEALRRYHTRVQNSLTTALQGIAAADRDKVAPVARRLATEAIREEIGRLAERRASAIASYEQALLFLGEATQPPESPEPPAAPVATSVGAQAGG